MEDQDRRNIIDALSREDRSAQERILATLTSFKNWIYLALYVVYLKIKHKLEPLWNWLRLAFA
jgi:hypothetical protein